MLFSSFLFESFIVYMSLLSILLSSKLLLELLLKNLFFVFFNNIGNSRSIKLILFILTISVFSFSTFFKVVDLFISDWIPTLFLFIFFISSFKGLRMLVKWIFVGIRLIIVIFGILKFNNLLKVILLFFSSHFSFFGDFFSISFFQFIFGRIFRESFFAPSLFIFSL